MSWNNFYELDKLVSNEIKEHINHIQTIYKKNFNKLLKSFQQCRAASHHLHPSYGYGLEDSGTQTVECIYSCYFNAEASIVRPQLISGTQALYLVLRSLLDPGDTFLSICGSPYETLQACIGIQEKAVGYTLQKQGINFRQLDILPNEEDSFKQIMPDDKVKMIWIQKSCGYSQRKSISNYDIQRWVPRLRILFPNAIVMVDNCYGEFVEEIEPIEAGADICAGSLLKNPGGGIAKTGAYICGKKNLIERCSDFLIAPGMGFETLPNLGMTAPFLQGLFIAPLVVREALWGKQYMACFMDKLGFKVTPQYFEPHYDLVLKISMENQLKWQAFANAVQAVSPLDSFVRPEPFHQKGYSSKIIMAGGTFTSGSSIEFSVDGIAAPPYDIYYQAGMVGEQSRVLAEKLYQDLI